MFTDRLLGPIKTPHVTRVFYLAPNRPGDHVSHKAGWRSLILLIAAWK